MPREEFPADEEDQQPGAPRPEEDAAKRTEQDPRSMTPDTVHPVDGSASRIDDPEQAYEMAHAAKEFRDEGAEERQRGGEVGRSISKGVDQEASRIEDWAGVLFSHPDIEALKEKYPGVEFTAEALAASEKELAIQLWVNNKLETDLSNPKVLQMSRILSGQGSMDFIPIEKVASRADSDTDDIQEQWSQLLENPDTTIGQLRDFYVDKFTRYVLNPKKANASINAAFFEDIRKTAKPAES